MSRPITVSVFENRHSTKAHHHTLTLAELHTRIQPAGTSKDGPAICGASFSPAIRKKANVTQVDALILDIDEAEGTIGDITRPLADYEALVWTTWSHKNPSKPKFRHLLPLARSVSPEEYAALWKHINDVLGGVIDPATKDASRLQYLPRETSETGDAPLVIHHKDRTRGWLDPDHLPGGKSVAELVERVSKRTTDAPPLEVDTEEVLSALESIDPTSLGYHDWLAVGMALHAEGASCDTWRAWSQRDPRYQDGDCDDRWDDFSSQGGVTAGTIFHLALKNGWQRPYRERKWMLEDGFDVEDGRIWYHGRNDARVAEHVLRHNSTSEALVYDQTRYWCWDGIVWRSLGGEQSTDALASTLHRWQREEKMWLRPTKKDDEGKPYILSSNQQRAIIAHTRIPAQRPGFFDNAPVGIAFGDVFVRVDGRKLAFEPSGPHQRQRHVYPWPYDPEAAAPETDARLREILKGDTEVDTEARVRLWWQFCGAAITGIAPRFMRALVLLGRKGSGKSTLAEILTAVMPKESVGSVSPHDFGDDRKTVAFANMRLNVVGELRHEKPIINHTVVKSVIGGEILTARDVYRSAVSLRPRAAHLWCANRVPSVPGVDGSWWDRMMLMQCKQSFRGSTHEELGLAQKLVEAELPGIVRRALQGAEELLVHGRYQIPLSSEEDLQLLWIGNADSVALFLQEVCEDCSGEAAWNWALGGDVHAAFLRWASLRKHSEMSHHELLERLQSRGVTKKRSNGTRLSVKVRPQPLWDEPDAMMPF